MTEETKVILQKMEELKTDITKSEERTKEYVNSRMGESEKVILSEVDSRIGKSENLVLSEVDRVQEIFENQFAQVKKNMEELRQYYKITQLESDNTAILLRMLDDVQKRLVEVERKTA